MGGGVVTYFALRERQLRPTRQVRTITLGEPREFDIAAFNLLDNDTKNRVQRDGDIVPYLPPDFTSYAWIFGIVGIVVANRWVKFIPNGRGSRLTAGGSLFPVDPQGAGTADLTLIIGEWLLSLPLTPFAAHRLKPTACRCKYLV